MRNAVVLLSGGLDSATVLAVALSEGLRCHALSFRYGQRHEAELASARLVAEALGAHRHEVVDLELGWIGGSALTSRAIDVPHHERVEDLDPGVIPVTYVPARNTVFLSHALAWAEVLEAQDIFIGVNAVDYSGYPDCRPAFIEAFERTANLATRAGVEGRHLRVRAPLVDLDKAAIIRLGVSLGVDYGLTTSCYDPRPSEGPREGPGGRPCGTCDACLLRARGFEDAGVADPAVGGPAADALRERPTGGGA